MTLHTVMGHCMQRRHSPADKDALPFALRSAQVLNSNIVPYLLYCVLRKSKQTDLWLPLIPRLPCISARGALLLSTDSAT